jgi:serine/threonine protein kinase
MPFAPGQILHNRYRIVRFLSQGGFGSVYRAWDTKLNGPCAIKESLDTSEAAQQQFNREATMLFNLRHSNLPKVFDAFSVPGQGQYLVMEFIEGEDLQQILDRTGGPLPEAQVLPWIVQVCDALAYLHTRTRPIIHRDVKPANVRITPEGTAVLVDFGIAKLYDPARRTTLGARAVTPGYSPFEQYGQRPTDARTDVYALGSTLYHLLTGHMPPESIERVNGTPLTPPRQLNPAISERIEKAILRAMAVLPDQRYQSMAEFRAGLAPLAAPTPVALAAAPIGGGVGKGTAPLVQNAPARPVIRQRPAWLYVSVLVLLVPLVILLDRWFLAGFGGSSSDPTATWTNLPAIFSIDTETPTLTPLQTATPTTTPSPENTATLTDTILPPSATPSFTTSATSTHTQTVTSTVKPTSSLASPKDTSPPPTKRPTKPPKPPPTAAP